ncbi:DUF1731 domain-containing protein [Amycolatopsis sp. NPDC051061]|uniref:epimerase n=1 Tax=Amycolatopsis sp. NPDC051061 TaxID=3155042 RepID=UPI0034334D7B
MKVVLPGGTGHLGRVLSRALVERGDEVVVLTRREATPEPGVRHVRWDGRAAGPWTAEIDGGDVVLNLAGRSVNCRYTRANLREMWNSRVDSARVVGGAIERATRPPRVWLQMSTATIYAHRYDAPNDETTGVLGGDEPGVPAYWAYSVDLARAWEREQEVANTPRTRKVALRTAMVMSPEPGGAFAMLLRLTRLGLGGPVAGGAQYLSWIHEDDLVRAIDFLVARDDLSGPVNLAAPEPLPYRDFLRALRAAAGVPLGLPATKWMAEIGALALRTDTELLLKSRLVVPGRLLEAGFVFGHPLWQAAAQDLVRRTRSPLRRVG